MEVQPIDVERHVRSGLRGRSVFTFAALALVLPFSSWIAGAAEAGDLRSQSVAYHQSELTTTAGVEKIYSELEAAAHEVCAVYDRRSATGARAHELCVEAAIGDAVARIGAPRLTARHESRSAALFDRGSTVASR